MAGAGDTALNAVSSAPNIARKRAPAGKVIRSPKAMDHSGRRSPRHVPPRHRKRLHQKIHQPARLDRQVLARRIHRVDAERHRAVGRQQFNQVAAAQVVGDDEVRLQDDALVVQRGGTAGVAVVGVDAGVGAGYRELSAPEVFAINEPSIQRRARPAWK